MDNGPSVEFCIHSQGVEVGFYVSNYGVFAS